MTDIEQLRKVFAEDPPSLKKMGEVLFKLDESDGTIDDRIWQSAHDFYITAHRYRGKLDIVRYMLELDGIVTATEQNEPMCFAVERRTLPNDLTFDTYADEVLKYGCYPDTRRIEYPALGLNGEAGEVAEQVKKMVRDDGGKLSPERREKLLKEAGDVLWYVAALAADLGSSLGEVAQMNREKLAARNAKGQIHGEGSER